MKLTQIDSQLRGNKFKLTLNLNAEYSLNNATKNNLICYQHERIIGIPSNGIISTLKLYDFSNISKLLGRQTTKKDIERIREAFNKELDLWNRIKEEKAGSHIQLELSKMITWMKDREDPETGTITFTLEVTLALSF
ncbi:MAG: hypothetical protein WC595_03750 [Candidatus Nanoarchaeia archaeon]